MGIYVVKWCQSNEVVSTDEPLDLKIGYDEVLLNCPTSPHADESSKTLRVRASF